MAGIARTARQKGGLETPQTPDTTSCVTWQYYIKREILPWRAVNGLHINHLGGFMHRYSPNKRRSVRKFTHGRRKTHRKNLSIMRGGWRL